MSSVLSLFKEGSKTFEEIVKEAHDAIVIVDFFSDQILWHNRRLNQLLQYPESKRIETIFEIIDERDIEKSAKWLATVYEQKGGVTSDIRLKDKNNQLIDVEISGKVIPFQKNAYAGVLYIRDIRKRMALIRQIQEKNEMLIEAMNYARRLQLSLMPPPEKLSELFPKSCILYLPKEILAGDFYFFQTIGNAHFLAVGDCTGHGIPGALLSILAITILKNVLQDAHEQPPATILKQIREEMIRALSVEGKLVRDGMDMSLIRWDGKILQFAGARQSLYLIRNQELIEYKGDPAPIGYCERDPNPEFTTHSISITEGDQVYLSTDGFPDQFGGPKQKKLTTGGFKKILLECAKKPMNERKQYIETFLRKWMGNCEQTDDILVVGIELP